MFVIYKQRIIEREREEDKKGEICGCVTGECDYVVPYNRKWSGVCVILLRCRYTRLRLNKCLDAVKCSNTSHGIT